MKHLFFFLRQAVANMNRHRQRTLFVLFCIAVGVAAIVSMRNLGLMVGAALTGNLQAQLRADVVLTPVNQLQALLQGEQVDSDLVETRSLFGAPPTFTTDGIERIRAWSRANGYDTILAVRQQGAGRVRAAAAPEQAELSNIYAFEPDDYPFYGKIDVVEPAGMTLVEALATPNQAVISRRLATSLSLATGDEILISGTQPFQVSAIVEDGAEASLTDLNAVLLPFAYLHYDAGADLFATRADTVYLRRQAGQPALAEPEIAAADDELRRNFPGVNVVTTADLAEQNGDISQAVTRLITTMGLVSLLIGGIGIANTMIVVVGRRTGEIAVLKTIGLQGRQITLMFLVEAAIMGLIGSLAGLALGLGLALLLQGLTERFFATALRFTLFPEALWLGLVTGLVVTLVFGFLPTVAAGRVRPAVVLLPGDTLLPRAGRLVSGLIALGLTAIMGLLVGQILADVWLGLLVAYGTLATLGLAVLLFWIIIIFFSRLPSLGSIRVKLAQRAMGAHAARSASTLLALVVGMFALSFVLLLTQSFLNLVNDLLASQIGGNVLVATESLDASRALDDQLAGLPDIRSVTRNIVYQAEVVGIDGERELEDRLAAAEAAGRAELGVPEPTGATGAGGLFGLGDLDPVVILLNLFLRGMTVQERGESTAYTLEPGGQDLSPAVPDGILVQGGGPAAWLGLEVGDRLLLKLGDEEVDLAITGFVAAGGTGLTINTGAATTAYVNPGVLSPTIDPVPPTYVIEVADEAIASTLQSLSDVPGVFAFDIQQLNILLERLVDQFTTLPLVVAVLALFASSVIIANTVSLATLERRRQIGIMKAIGLQTSDVLSLMLLENGLLGLLGGLIGAGIGAAGILVTGLVAENPASFPLLTLLLLVLLAIAVALGATLITAVGAAREKPLVVLRYE